MSSLIPPSARTLLPLAMALLMPAHAAAACCLAALAPLDDTSHHHHHASGPDSADRGIADTPANHDGPCVLPASSTAQRERAGAFETPAPTPAPTVAPGDLNACDIGAPERLEAHSSILTRFHPLRL